MGFRRQTRHDCVSRVAAFKTLVYRNRSSYGFGTRGAIAFLAVCCLLLPTAIQATSEPELVKDINKAGGSSPQDFVDVNGTLFFVASDDTGD